LSVKHPVPIMYITPGDDATVNPPGAPAPGQVRQASLYNDKWNWLPTRVENQSSNPSIFESARLPHHVGVDVCITDPSWTSNSTPYVVYDVFKTTYFAFKHE